MKGVKPIGMDKAKAKEAWKEYCAGLKGKKGAWLKEYWAAKYAYFNLKEGKKILDVFEAFKKAGLNNLGYPRLAIAPISQRRVWFKNNRDGSGEFLNKSSWNASYAQENYVKLPIGTFAFPQVEFKALQLDAAVPLIPPKFLPKNLVGYFVLWEIERWATWREPPRDPLLLKRISNNLFVVIAYWNLTALERAIMRGR